MATPRAFPRSERNVTSLARVPPANAPPGERYAPGPIRASDFRPRSTSDASAPTCSQSAATSLMNVTEVARKAFKACLVISADSTDIQTIRSVNGRNSSAIVSRSWA